MEKPFGARRLRFSQIRLATRLQVRRTYKQFAIPLLSITLLSFTGFSLLLDNQSYSSERGKSPAAPVVWNPRHLLSAEQTSTLTNGTNSTVCVHTKGVCSDYCASEFPKDIFTCDQKRKGAIVFHVLGLIYMFFGLAIVCDEFFVPSLYCIIDRLQISEDVGGATFLAVGISAPELAISVIGTFMGKSNVGIGTIVGSAVFNFLFIISICAFFNKSDALLLSWWPLFRDVLFYGVSLTVLILVFLDSKIHYYEALALIFCYLSYVVFMKYNTKIENAVKQRCNCCKSVETIDDGIARISQDETVKESDVDSNKTRAIPNGLDEENNLKSVVQTNCSNISALHSSDNQIRPDIFRRIVHIEHSVAGTEDRNVHLVHISVAEKYQEDNTVTILNSENQNGSTEIKTNKKSIKLSTSDNIQTDAQSSSIVTNDLSENFNSTDAIHVNDKSNDKPLSLSWPSTIREKIVYVIFIPLIFLLWLTLNDVRRKSRSKYFVLTFLVSIIWIGSFSFLMVWWARMICEIIGIPEGVMGLTFLAAGTSIPDMLTAIIVVQKGYGDMAVSSSFGSNIFDITVGLPIPWFVYTLWKLPNPTEVSSHGMFCLIILLFIMIMVKVITFVSFKWRLTKKLGGAMLFYYFVFIVVSVLHEYSIITCPF